MAEPKEMLERETIERLGKPEPTLKDLADNMKLLYNKIWSKEELEEYIKAVHVQLCENCTRGQRIVGKRGYVGYALLVLYVLAQLIAAKLGFSLPALSQITGG